MASPFPEAPALLGQSRAFLDLMDQVSRVAPLDRPVLVVGERGTGKELVAARLHFLSRRWGRPLVKVNCAALPETLLETELFGHEAGAFTGAARQRAGRFERADQGSLFLDEISAASPAAQEKILRVVEYGELERVGASAVLTVDVRVVAAANVDLPGEADAGRFRHDLLDRLAFDVLTVPPLRAREDDISLLTHHFGRAMALDMGWETFPGFSAGAAAALAEYPWPGNVRELRNVVERAVHHWGDPSRPVDALRFDPFDSPFRPRPSISPAPVPRTDTAKDDPLPDASHPFALESVLAGLETGLLEKALEANRHNQRATARHLGLTYHQLRNRLTKFGLLRPRN